MKSLKKFFFIPLCALLCASCSDDDIWSVDFHLENAAGTVTDEFRQGESIMFVLTITNMGDEAAELPVSDRDILGDQLFSVYDAAGNYVGKPYSSYADTEILLNHIAPGGTRSWWVEWTFSDTGTRAYEFQGDVAASPLPAGRYFSRFPIRVGGKTVMCQTGFSVVP